MDNEIWKSIEGFSNYSISSQGRIKNTKTSKYLKPRTYKGYKKINLSKNNKPYSFRVHRLVAQAFLDNYSDKYEVDHINGIRDDNNINNLRCVTRKANLKNRKYNNRKYIIDTILYLKEEKGLHTTEDLLNFLYKDSLLF